MSSEYEGGKENKCTFNRLYTFEILIVTAILVKSRGQVMCVLEQPC